MKTTLLILVMLFLSSCSTTKSSNWPSGMTPFFAECQSNMKVYTDKAFFKRKRKPCRAGWKFYERGEPTLTND
jgi:hypothetical protein